MEKLIKYKVTIILVVAIMFIFGLGYFGVKTFILDKREKLPQQIEEVDITFDPEGAYGILTPRRDGNALVLTIRRIASYDDFSYQLTYSDENGVDRGAGDLDTWIKLPKDKTEYEQELLLGSCSKNVCAYDKGVENGTLAIHFRKANIIYKSSSQWQLQRPEVSAGVLTSGDSHFRYQIGTYSDAERTKMMATNTIKKVVVPSEISLLQFTVINDLSGAPKLPNNKNVTGKVYALNSISGKDIASGKVTIELANTPSLDSKIAVFTTAKGDWELLDSTIKDGVMEATASSGGIFTVLTP